MRENAYATHRLHCQLLYGRFRGKNSISTASLHQYYASIADELAAA